jgi:hypothetical protein
MPLVKRASKRKGMKQALPVLGVVGISLTLAGGTSEGTGWNIARSDEITLYEEEIFDVSLGTFFVFDKESAETPRLGEKYAQLACRGCRGCRAFGGGLRGGIGGCQVRQVRPPGQACRGCGGGCKAGGCGCGGGGGGVGCGGVVGAGCGCGGGGGCGAVFRAPIPIAPAVENSEDSEDQARPKAKKKPKR